MNIPKITLSERHEKAIFFLVITVYMAITSYLALNREYFSFGTETDFLGGFMKEAQRILSGQALTLDFHPPLYASVVALFQYIFDDWFLAGRVISLLSSLAVMITSFYFFRFLVGKSAGWAALLASMASPVFMQYSTQATSDLFFYSLYCSTLLLAIMAFRRNSMSLWIVAGIFIGLVMLSRSNGFTLLMLLLLPWLGKSDVSTKVYQSLTLFAGTLVTILTWAIIASYSGSPFMPAGNYVNLALTYFPPGTDRLSGDARWVVESQFHSMWQVLTHDPTKMAKMYFSDLANLIKYFVASERLLYFPVYLFLVPGIILLLLRFNKIILFYLLILTLPQVLLINLKFFEPRYYLFLVPLYGIAVVASIEKILSYITLNYEKHVEKFVFVLLILSIICILPITKSIENTTTELAESDKNLAESVTQISTRVLPGAYFVTRKPHIPFYANGKPYTFPNLATYEELEADLDKLAETSPVYVYYGKIESKFRPQFKDLLTGNLDKPNFSIVVQSSKAGEWVLYEYKKREKKIKN